MKASRRGIELVRARDQVANGNGKDKLAGKSRTNGGDESVLYIEEKAEESIL